MRIECAGANAFLLDMAGKDFQDSVQTRIWGLAHSLNNHAAIKTVIPGANNLLVIFEPEGCEADAIRSLLKQEWDNAASAAIEPQEVSVPVLYGEEHGVDLASVAEHVGLTPAEVIRLHVSGVYRVAMIGYSPGFGYLTGLPKPLHVPRRDTPRLSVERNSVCIGGVFSCVMAHTAPSGWHILGMADCPPLFDPASDTPCSLKAGDIVRFTRA